MVEQAAAVGIRRQRAFGKHAAAFGYNPRVPLYRGGSTNLGLGDVTVRLIAAVVLGGAIGLERELRHKAAGLRTNALIAVGAAAFTIVGLQLAGSSGDPSRIASTIVTGIGFLGAGAILRTTGGVHGLTTAATIWVNAAIGMAAGSGAMAFATVLTAIVLAVLWIVGLIERRVEQRLGNPHRDQPGPST